MSKIDHLFASEADGYRLLVEGAKALAHVESNGIRIDTSYLNRTIAEMKAEIGRLEGELKLDKDVWPTWSKRYKDKAKLNAPAQLAQVLFTELKHPCKSFTTTGLPQADEAAIEKIDLPFVKTYLRYRKLQKVQGTYLGGILREVCDGLLHPSFNLHIVDTFRSSSDSPNFQNQPIRNPEMKKLIRPCFIPRPGNRLVELDYGGIEVKVAACYHHDPTMMKYINDKTTDMHRDMAMQLFKLKKDEVDDGTTRHISKNRFVFPQFYGSFYVDCAKNIWEELVRSRAKVAGTDVLVIDHLKAKGIRRLGACEMDQSPVPGTFEYHLKQVEDDFWNVRFPVYTRWKKDWYNAYLDKGEFRMFTGFVCRGLYRRNQVINFPVQGPAFHCLLKAIPEMIRRLRKYKMKAKIVGQIHDSALADVPDKEIQNYLDIGRDVMTVYVPKQFRWINVPLEVGAEVTPVDGSWLLKEKWSESGGKWAPKSRGK